MKLLGYKTMEQDKLSYLSVRRTITCCAFLPGYCCTANIVKIPMNLNYKLNICFQQLPYSFLYLQQNSSVAVFWYGPVHINNDG